MSVLRPGGPAPEVIIVAASVVALPQHATALYWDLFKDPHDGALDLSQ